MLVSIAPYSNPPKHKAINSLLVNMKNSTTPPKPIIPTPEINSSDLQLSQCRGTHDAWLHCNIEVCFLEDARWVVFEDFFKCNELCMTSTLHVMKG